MLKNPKLWLFSQISTVLETIKSWGPNHSLDRLEVSLSSLEVSLSSLEIKLSSLEIKFSSLEVENTSL